MKKKNLIVLLIIPFLISALTIVTVNVSYNLIDVDISHIQWDFEDIEAFQIGEDKVILSAEGVNNRNHKVGKGNELVWFVKNKNAEDPDPCASIEKVGSAFYLTTLKVGEVIVTCANTKGNVSRSFTAILYKDGAVYLTPTLGQSKYDKVDETNYFGEFDLVNGKKESASFAMQLVAIPASVLETVSIQTEGQSVLNIDKKNATISGGKAVVDGRVEVRGEGETTFKLATTLDSENISLRDYGISVVKEGVNVYTFEDLMACTNKSEEGEIAVLQSSFVAEKTKYDTGEVCYGNKKDGKFDFSVEYITTKYNHEFLKQWNKIAVKEKVYEPKVCVGLHVKKDMYGNGNMINFHNLAYPSQTIGGTPMNGADDLFRGPLPFYTVGNPRGGSDMSDMNLISAYAQDNIGMYVQGNGITLNDIVVKNCDDVNSLSHLSTVGTVVEIEGEGITLKNMRLSNGRQVVRSFSNHNLTLDNCRLSNARNFLFVTGSNEFSNKNQKKAHTFMTATKEITSNLTDYLSAKGEGNVLLSEYLDGIAETTGTYGSKARLKEAMMTLQRALDDESVRKDFKGSTEIKDCAFERSGISCIALESLFNGPFLYSPDSPTNIAPFFAMLNNMLVGKDFVPRNISGTSYPVKINLSGKTRFYDYKTWDEVDVSGLVNENISTLVKEILKRDGYGIDNIFPIKKLLKAQPYSVDVEGVKKVNIPITYYGGGANYSQITTNGLDFEVASHLTGASEGKPIEAEEISLLDEYMVLPPVRPSSISSSGGLGGLLEGLKVDQNTLIKTVTLVTGCEPFRFVFINGGYLVNQSPTIEEMKENAQRS